MRKKDQPRSSTFVVTPLLFGLDGGVTLQVFECALSGQRGRFAYNTRANIFTCRCIRVWVYFIYICTVCGSLRCLDQHRIHASDKLGSDYTGRLFRAVTARCA